MKRNIYKVCLIQVDGGEIGKWDEPSLSLCNIAEPLGLLSIHAYLEKLGHKVLLLHPAIEEERLLSKAEILKRIIEFNPEVVGFSAMTNQIPETINMARSIKSITLSTESISPKIIIGGDHISGYPQDLLKLDDFDFGVVGEGEECASWILDNLTENWESPFVPSGVYWKSGGELLGNGRAERIENIDSLPRPSRFKNLLNYSRVGELMWPPRNKQTGMASIYASRGCPYSCKYCDARQIWGNQIKWRPPQEIVKELQYLKKEFVINTAFFVDLTFNSDREKLIELCSEIENANLGIYWYVLLRPGNNEKTIVDYEMLNALKAAGCIKVGFGIETLSQEVGAELGRKPIGGYLKNIMEWADNLGILSKVFLMIGHPHETSDYYSHVKEYLKLIGPDEVRISFLTPFPGTPLWDIYKENLLNTSKYEKFTTFRPIIHHPSFSSNELLSIRDDLLLKYYSSNEYRERVEKKILLHPSLNESFKEFENNVLLQLGYSNNLDQIISLRFYCRT